MIAIDTNVLLRYLLQDDKTQSSKANRLIEGTKKVLVSDVVIAETIWTLKGKKYALEKDQLLSVLDRLFKEPNIEFEDGQTVWRAANSYRLTERLKVGSKKKAADFSDTLILEKSKYNFNKKNFPFEGLFSFDEAAQQIDGIEQP